jgi:hypothetical protein
MHQLAIFCGFSDSRDMPEGQSDAQSSNRLNTNSTKNEHAIAVLLREAVREHGLHGSPHSCSDSGDRKTLGVEGEVKHGA